MTYNLDLTSGFGDHPAYHLWKFDGGEIHFVLKDLNLYMHTHVNITTRLNSSDDIMTLLVVVDTLRKDYRVHSLVRTKPIIDVLVPYMPYQQADRDFGHGECFSLQTISKIFSIIDVDRYIVYMPHSDISPAMVPNMYCIQDHKFVRHVITGVLNKADQDIIILTPDAGAYKRIGKLTSSINFQGSVVSANKYRNTSSGNIESIDLGVRDFEGADVMIIDDLCIGGGTFLGLAKVLRTRNVGKLYLTVSHMIRQVINPALFDQFDKIFTTNSRFNNYIVNKEVVSVNEVNDYLYVYNIVNSILNKY